MDGNKSRCGCYADEHGTLIPCERMKVLHKELERLQSMAYRSPGSAWRKDKHADDLLHARTAYEHHKWLALCNHSWKHFIVNPMSSQAEKLTFCILCYQQQDEEYIAPRLD